VATIATAPEAFVFMKVGDHAGETFEQILERKNREIKRAGFSFWGYGGTACHPISQVQPFAKSVIQKQGSIYLLMQPIHSTADPEIIPATLYSEDGVEWKRIPKEIQVTGSRYALVLSEILPGELDISPDEFVVGVGPSRGKPASEYLQGRVDKACLCRENTKVKSTNKNNDRKEIKYMAKLQEPFAVLLK
jgi:hypothetical protein